MSSIVAKRKRDGALLAANTVRGLLGLPAVEHLYPGTPRSPEACAITETIYDDDLDRDRYVVFTTSDGVKVFDRTMNHKRSISVYHGHPDIYVLHNSWAAEFIDTFDKGRFRNLIKKVVK